MSGLSKQFLFGDALDGIDTGGLNLAEFGLNNLIEQAQKDSDDENKSENNNRENSEDNNYDNLEIPSDEESDINLNENDLGIETLCEDNKGKIFKFSDLIIPMDEKDILSTEKFLRKKMEKIKKDKNEKIENEEIKKREKNEEEEISFFDKTLFTKKEENINNLNKEKKIGENKMNIEEEEKNNKDILQKDFPLKKDMINNYDDLIKNTLFQFNKNYYKKSPNDNISIK